MSVRRYLPSAQFFTIVGALAASGGLVLAAQYITKTPPATITTNTPTPFGGDWQQKLDEIQANSGISLPPAPDPNQVQTLLSAAQSSNVTATVARSLLVNLSSANAQGLGQDLPTQDSLIAGALAQLPPTPASIYSMQSLHTVPNSTENLHTYGNAVMEIFGHHTDATSKETLMALSQVTDTQDIRKLPRLVHIQNEYHALAEELASMSVPSTLTPLHVQFINDINAAALTFDGIRTVLDDPLRGLQSLQQYNSLLGEAGRVLTTIASTFSKNGILFNKDEPGSAWSVLLSASTTQ